MFEGGVECIEVGSVSSFWIRFGCWDVVLDWWWVSERVTDIGFATYFRMMPLLDL